MKTLLTAALLAVIAVPAMADTQLFGAWSPTTKTFSELSSTSLYTFPGIFGSRKTLRVGAVAGLGASAAVEGGFDASTGWHLATGMDFVVGVIGTFTVGQKPTFGGFEFGVKITL